MDVQNCSSCLPFPQNSEDHSNGLDKTEYQPVSPDDISESLKEKLQISKSSNNGHLNGCTKVIYEESKNVINGLIKYHNLDRIRSHECFNEACQRPTTESKNTSYSQSKETKDTSNYCSNDILPELSSSSITNLPKETSSIVESDIVYIGYESEKQMPDIMRLIQKDLSEPYSIYTYRYFIHNWPKLCFLAYHKERCVGAIVCKLDVHKKHSRRGYIAMLAVDEMYRKRKIGSNLVLKAIKAMVNDSADEVVLETEITNKSALRLYENLGFVRDKRLFRYYLNGVDALRLKLWIR